MRINSIDDIQKSKLAPFSDARNYFHSSSASAQLTSHLVIKKLSSVYSMFFKTFIKIGFLLLTICDCQILRRKHLLFVNVNQRSHLVKQREIHK